jgi:hypothetical protein
VRATRFDLSLSHYACSMHGIPFSHTALSAHVCMAFLCRSGLRAVQARREETEQIRRDLGTAAPERPDFIARNIANVAPGRTIIGRKEQALLARAEVMAAATAHLGSTVQAAPRAQRPAPAAAPDTKTDALLRKAREELERGFEITAIEAQTRRPPAKLAGLGKGKAFTGAVTGSLMRDKSW